MRLASGVGETSPPRDEAWRRHFERFRYWKEPLIPFVGPFLFAGHIEGAGYVALSITSGTLQIIGSIVAVYGIANHPASPSVPRAGLRLGASGLELRF